MVNENSDNTGSENHLSGSAHQEPELVTTREEPGRGNNWFHWVRDISICLVLVLLFRANVAEANYIPSPSMEPTLHVRDRIIVDKISMHWRDLEHGDLVVFHPPLEGRENERWIKRVIGLPGDSIEIRKGQVYRNGEPVEESYIYNRPHYNIPFLTLGKDDPSTPENEGEYYLLGDNRRNSRDSHVWGPCPADSIIGRAIFRYWPPSGIGGLSNQENTEQ